MWRIWWHLRWNELGNGLLYNIEYSVWQRLSWLVTSGGRHSEEQILAGEVQQTVITQGQWRLIGGQQIFVILS